MLANVPYTFIGIKPTNHKLKAMSEADAGPNSRTMLVLWGSYMPSERCSAFLRLWRICGPLQYGAADSCIQRIFLR